MSNLSNASMANSELSGNGVIIGGLSPCQRDNPQLNPEGGMVINVTLNISSATQGGLK